MSDTYAGLTPDSYANWTSNPDAAYSSDPIAALERFFEACKKEPERHYPRPLFVHCSEWPKARDGQVFFAEGVYWRWTDRNAPPEFVGFSRGEVEGKK